MVDDDPAALELARLALDPAGWTLRTCTQADEVFRLVRESRPSVVLVDLLMPDMDGFEVIDRVARRPGHRLRADRRADVQDPDARRTAAPSKGRIEFVTSKNAMDLGLLASRLSEVTRGDEIVGRCGMSMPPTRVGRAARRGQREEPQAGA